MVAVRGADPKMQLFDGDGNPLSGGKVYTYEAGTLTPLATYINYDTTDFNTNPIILDADGRASVFWSPNTLYDVIVTDSNDVQLYTVSSYNVAGASGGSSNPGFGAATDIASSTTVDMGSITSHFANITGTVPINSFGNSASVDAPLYLVKSQSAGLVINLSGNILAPGFTNEIITTQNDYWWMDYLGSGAWKIFDYFRGDGSTNEQPGFLKAFAGVTPPAGWLLCYGQAVSRTTYSQLFAAISTTWGGGDGTTTFNLPDLRGRGLFGKDDMGGSSANRVTAAGSGMDGDVLATVGGSEFLATHNHTLTDPGHVHTISLRASATGAGNFVPQAGTDVAGGTATINSNTTGITLASAGTGSSANMPPAAIVNWCVKI